MTSERLKTRRQLLLALASCGVTRDALAQDAVTADPRSFRIVLDNERVRVLDFRSGPGLSVCGQGMHFHPERVTIAMTGAKIRLTDAEGRTALRDIPAGQVFFSPAETHSVENIGGAGTRIYIIELKGDDYQPSTG